MRAFRVHDYGQPPTAALDDLPDLSPGPGQVLVGIEAAGVNPADTYMAAGNYAIKPDPPYIPGQDAAGTILAVGEGVKRWNKGDRVIIGQTAAGRLQGCYAEQALCAEDWLWALPGNLSFAQGAAVNITHVTAFRALFDVARARPGDRVLIHGATGGVGLAALQIARAHELFVIGTCGSEEGRELLWQHGADVVLDHSAEGYLDGLKSDPPDVILEMLANVNLARDMEVIAPHGRIVVIGSRGEITVNPRLLMGKQAAIIGVNYWSDGEKAVRRAMDAIVQGIEAGDIKPVIQAELPLAEAARAWEMVMTSKSLGKIVLVP
jgi:NADPH2:quinone reductase